MAKMPHIQLDESIGATAAILPGDPARVDVIARYLTDVREETFNREYKSITGSYKGRRILAISTGMGGPSTAICVEELADLGVKDMIRIGSCGALQKDLELGQLVICSRAVCDDGTSQSYLGYLNYSHPELAGMMRLPDEAEDEAETSVGQAEEAETEAQQADAAKANDAAAEAAEAEDEEESLNLAWADLSLVGQCLKAARELGVPNAVGSTRSHDALYLPAKGNLDEFYSAKGVSASDMETAALFAVGEARGVRTCSILNVVVEWKKDLKEGISSYKGGEDKAAEGEQNEILVALEALAAAGA